LGGLIAGVLDGIDAVVFYGLSFGVTPTLLFQNIAAGLLGRRSFHGGWYTTLLGVVCHFSIAIGAAAVFYWASLVVPVLFRKPWICGPAFGVLVYLFMHYVVVPLSAVPKRTVPVTLFEVWISCFRTPYCRSAHRSNGTKIGTQLTGLDRQQYGYIPRPL
jgi:hypothetical protein